MIQPSTLLSLFLAGMGIAFTLTGSISAVKIRRTRSITSLGSPQKEAEPVREESVQFAEQTSTDTLHRKMASHMGVRAIFSGDENPQPPLGVLSPSTEPSHRRVFSKRIISSITGIAALALYGVAVWQYALHESIQSWVRANFGAATYLLNYDALLVASVIVALEIFWSQFRKTFKEWVPDRQKICPYASVLPLSRILPDSCEKVGGFGDGHRVAASGVFPVGREEAFLEALDALVTTTAG